VTKRVKSLTLPSTEEIIRTLRAHLPELRQRYGVRALGVFGSYVRGEAKKRSDLDILVELSESEITLFQYIELEQYLSDLVQVRVDLVEKETLKPAIGRHILKEVLWV